MSESIYNWVTPEPVAPAKEPLFRSNHNWNGPISNSTLKGANTKKPAATFGTELKGTVRPDAFLRAHERSGHVNTSTLRECACACLLWP